MGFYRTTINNNSLISWGVVNLPLVVEYLITLNLRVTTECFLSVFHYHRVVS